LVYGVAIQVCASKRTRISQPPSRQADARLRAPTGWSFCVSARRGVEAGAICVFDTQVAADQLLFSDTEHVWAPTFICLSRVCSGDRAVPNPDLIFNIGLAPHSKGAIEINREGRDGYLLRTMGYRESRYTAFGLPANECVLPIRPPTVQTAL